MGEVLEFSPIALSLAWELEQVNYNMTIYLTINNSFVKRTYYKVLLNNKYFSVVSVW